MAVSTCVAFATKTVMQSHKLTGQECKKVMQGCKSSNKTIKRDICIKTMWCGHLK